jgi:glucose/arabinose dehydrogenase
MLGGGGVPLLLSALQARHRPSRPVQSHPTPMRLQPLSPPVRAGVVHTTALTAGAFLLFCHGVPTRAAAPPTPAVQTGPIAECRWAPQPPVLDGKLDDPVWKNAQVVETFHSRWLDPEQKEPGLQKPPTRTVARLLWDRQYLYFSAEMEDADVYATETKQDGEIWSNDVFELFFKPSAKHLGYYEFEINAANAKLDMFLPSRGAGGYARFAKDRAFHIESAVQVRGTLNDWTDKDEGWIVEGRIPWSDFLPTGGTPALGEVWLHALCRYDYSVGFEGQSLSSNAPLEKPNFHRYENYVPLKFVGPTVVAQGEPQTRWQPGPMQGSPESPPPFRTTVAFPNLKTRFPIALVQEPQRESFLLVENDGYVPERAGRIQRVASMETGVPELLLAVEESLYDLCFHPDFVRNGWVFIGANGRFGPGKEDFNNRVLRYQMDPGSGRILPGTRQVLLEWRSLGHNGMALGFGGDGMLYVTSGDGTSDSDEWDTGQDLSQLYSKVLRLYVSQPGPGLYTVPKDNPFLTVAGARPETWAYGFRNPWRMHIDRKNGDVWVGENGQDLWEYARIVRGGENYGWPLMEGNHDFQRSRKAGPTPVSKALIEHSHSDFRSLTGGIVYYGNKHPQLQGHYVYGDYSTGQIWAASQQNRMLVNDRILARTQLNIVHFSETRAGDLLVIDHNGHAIHRLEPAVEAASAPGDMARFPRRLSETGLFSGTTLQAPHPGLLPYSVNAAGWHDGATARRWIALPGDESMEVTPRGGWKLPAGSAVVQTLERDGRKLETRILLKDQREWAGYSYAWNADQTDADLVPAAGRTTDSWVFPSRQECSVCHSRQAGFLLGVSTLQLNRKDGSGVSQLARWEAQARLYANHAADAEAAWRREFAKDGASEAELLKRLRLVQPTSSQRTAPSTGTVLATAVEQLPALPDPTDTSRSLDERARAYLHANCSHCHVRNGGGNAAVQFGYDVPEKERGFFTLPMHSSFGIPDAHLIAPGDPAKSVVLMRTAMRGTGQMPPLGTLRPDPALSALLIEWIASLPRPAVK